MFSFGSMLLALIALVVCPCVSCLGSDTGLSRQQVWRHSTQHGIADPAWIARARAANQVRDNDWLFFDNEGTYDDDLPDGNRSPDRGENQEQEEEDEDSEFWKGDPFYEQVKPHLEDLLRDANATTAVVQTITLELLRWKRLNRVTDRATNQLLALLSRDSSSGFPKNLSAAWNRFNGFKVLQTETYEMCYKGCHRFSQGSAAGKNCPVCGRSTRDAHGTATTTTFTKFPLKDKLRILFADPQKVALLKSHASAGTPDNLRGEGNQRRTCSIYGASAFC
mmetsp:Transcript_35712/g.77949  ORF Transcript_35712/g.77949 Transcript_35712/m.77949 type:complete len:279 (+) Transcript_35712:116-952(+)